MWFREVELSVGVTSLSRVLSTDVVVDGVALALSMLPCKTYPSSHPMHSHCIVTYSLAYLICAFRIYSSLSNIRFAVRPSVHPSHHTALPFVPLVLPIVVGWHDIASFFFPSCTPPVRYMHLITSLALNLCSYVLRFRCVPDIAALAISSPRHPFWPSPPFAVYFPVLSTP